MRREALHLCLCLIAYYAFIFCIRAKWFRLRSNTSIGYATPILRLIGARPVSTSSPWKQCRYWWVVLQNFTMKADSEKTMALSFYPNSGCRPLFSGGSSAV